MLVQLKCATALSFSFDVSGTLRRRRGALVVRDAVDARQHAARAAARGEGAARPPDGRVAARRGGARERVHPVVSRRARALRRRCSPARRSTRRPPIRSCCTASSRRSTSRRTKDARSNCERVDALLLAAAAVASAPRSRRGASRDRRTATPDRRPATHRHAHHLRVGDEVFERFGHNALWFHDREHRRGRRVSLGAVQLQRAALSPALPHRRHEVLRWAAWTRRRSSSSSAAAAGRSRCSGLNLTPAQAQALRDFVRWNALEENKYYRYDYFRDNCSTRLRDALDRAIGGAIERRRTRCDHAHLSPRERPSHRTATDPSSWASTSRSAGPPTFRSREWQSFFIPMRLRDAIRDVQDRRRKWGARAARRGGATSSPPATPKRVEELATVPS